ncbi:hypothetical protein ACFYNO_34245 [Kitasatospora sp. NPDC006697]
MIRIRFAQATAVAALVLSTFALGSGAAVADTAQPVASAVVSPADLQWG